MVGGFCGNVDDERGVNAGKMLADMLVSGRARSAGVPWPDDEPPFTRGTAPSQIRLSSEEIIAAHKKALGETVVELPSDPVARGIVIADMRRRGDPPYRRAQSEPVHIDDPTAVAAKIIAAAARARGEK
jgi:hypothetical protein